MQLTEKDRADTKIPQLPAQPFFQDCQDLLLCALAGLSLREVAAAEAHPEPKVSKGAGAQTLRSQDCAHLTAVTYSDASASVENILFPSYLFFV